MPRVALAAFAAVLLVGMLAGVVAGAVFAAGVVFGRVLAVLAVLERQHRSRAHPARFLPPGQAPTNVRRIR